MYITIMMAMTADELETWLKGPDSQSSGGSKPDTSGESIGHERCIICDIDHPLWGSQWPQDHLDP
jgi:hypothetical protein